MIGLDQVMPPPTDAELLALRDLGGGFRGGSHMETWHLYLWGWCIDQGRAECPGTGTAAWFFQCAADRGHMNARKRLGDGYTHGMTIFDEKMNCPAFDIYDAEMRALDK